MLCTSSLAVACFRAGRGSHKKQAIHSSRVLENSPNIRRMLMLVCMDHHHHTLVAPCWHSYVIPYRLINLSWHDWLCYKRRTLEQNAVGLRAHKKCPCTRYQIWLCMHDQYPSSCDAWLMLSTIKEINHVLYKALCILKRHQLKTRGYQPICAHQAVYVSSLITSATCARGLPPSTPAPSKMFKWLAELNSPDVAGRFVSSSDIPTGVLGMRSAHFL